MSNDFDPSILMEMLDRPIAYQRCFVTISNSVTAAVMLSQAIYWAKRTSDPDKWFWKSQAEWEEETGLTRSEQETARKKLAAIGVLEEKKQGLPCRLYFRVNTRNLYLQLIEINNQVCSNQSNQFAEIPQTSDRNLCVLEGGIPATNLYTEITTENTSEITAKINTAQKISDSDFEIFREIWNSDRPKHWARCDKLDSDRIAALKKFVKKATKDRSLEIFRAALSYARSDFWCNKPQTKLTIDNFMTNNKPISWAEKAFSGGSVSTGNTHEDWLNVLEAV